MNPNLNQKTRCEAARFSSPNASLLLLSKNNFWQKTGSFGERYCLQQILRFMKPRLKMNDSLIRLEHAFSSYLHCTAGSSRSFAATRKDAGLYCGSRLRSGEVFAYVESIQNLKDLKDARQPPVGGMQITFLESRAVFPCGNFACNTGVPRP